MVCVRTTVANRNFVANNNAVYSLQLWDTPGLQRLHQLLSLYYREAEAVVVLYDITNSKSFERVNSASMFGATKLTK